MWPTNRKFLKSNNCSYYEVTVVTAVEDDDD